MENRKLKRKIYICDAGNEQYGINYRYNLYMSSDQVDENRGKIRREYDGEPFIYVCDLSTDDYYDAAKMRRVAREYNVNVNILWDTLDWQSPETLAAELSEHKWEF